MKTQRRLMVVGARSGNLGMKIIEDAMRSQQWGRIQGYDIQGAVLDQENPRYFNITDRHHVIIDLEDFSPTDIVCAVGVNYPEDDISLIAESMKVHHKTNVYGPMLLLQEAIDNWTQWAKSDPASVPETGFNFVAISSNSAHVARSQSAGYCASKAALSMALRCVARRVAGARNIKIWAFEPGFISDTPMSKETAEQMPGVPLHRIPGGEGIPKADVSRAVLQSLEHAYMGLNGCMIRMDGGEQ